ncbi:MAG: hypothetical protein ACK5LV_10765, partial [Lachnospirales bacterium]
MDLIRKDDSISDSQEFYIMKNGTTKTKNEILSMLEFNLTSFLLGIWHFAIQINNIEGESTVNRLCPSANGGKREYKGTLGKEDNSIMNIRYEQLEASDKSINTEQEVEIIEDIL